MPNFILGINEGKASITPEKLSLKNWNSKEGPKN